MPLPTDHYCPKCEYYHAAPKCPKCCGALATTPCSPNMRDPKTAFQVRLHDGLHASITDPALREKIYRIVENFDQETTSVFWDSDEHSMEFVGDGWAVEFHQENNKD